jgi:hypothetical protein
MSIGLDRSETMSIKIYGSLSVLIREVVNGTYPGDQPDTLYYFGCNNDIGSIRSVAFTHALPVELIIFFDDFLQFLDQQGKVFWHSNLPGRQFQHMIAKARAMGAPVPSLSTLLSSVHYHQAAQGNQSALIALIGPYVDWISL